MKNSISNDLRQKAAREAALLLYTQQEKEYKQAKVRAAKSLGINFLPNNREIAEQLDLLAEEIEGEERKRRLIEMRREALKIMKILKNFHPKLVGSVWRGTINKNSDIDITVFHSEPEKILKTLENFGYKPKRIERQSFVKKGIEKTFFHIFLTVSNYEVEIVVKPEGEIEKVEFCEIYGDKITGLGIKELEKVLRNDPLKRFVPK